MSTVAIVILAVVQGVTEFLPISSSGHLVVVAAVLSATLGVENLEVPDVNIVLHAGTLLSIMVHYWHRLWRLLGEDRRLAWLLAAATAPGAAAGVVIKLWFESVLENALLAGCMLVVTGVLLLLTARLRPRDGECSNMTLGTALLIGLAQAAAILPGISRSGSTIFTGLCLGLSPRAAATFSFLMAVPIIGGGAVWEIKDMATDATFTTPIGTLLLGAMISFGVGLLSLHWLIQWLERGRLHLFAWWCIPLGIGVAAWQIAFAG